MPGFLTNVVKGGFCGRADERLSRLQTQGETASDFRKRLGRLRDHFVAGKPLHEIAGQKVATVDELVVRNPGDQKHSKDEFFGDNAAQCFFPLMAGDSEDNIVRGAFIRALDLALAVPAPGSPKPIVTYWIVTGRADGAPDAFEAFVAETAAEVHVLLLTPEPVNVPAAPPGGEIVEDMFVVATNQRIQQITQKFQQPSYSVIPVVVPGVVGVGCLQVVGY
jgi:hypothetical protein